MVEIQLKKKRRDTGGSILFYDREGKELNPFFCYRLVTCSDGDLDFLRPQEMILLYSAMLDKESLNYRVDELFQLLLLAFSRSNALSLVLHML
jgi:hypothetical protein